MYVFWKNDMEKVIRNTVSIRSDTYCGLVFCPLLLVKTPKDERTKNIIRSGTSHRAPEIEWSERCGIL